MKRGAYNPCKDSKKKRSREFRISEKEMENLTHKSIADSLDTEFGGTTENGDWRIPGIMKRRYGC